MKVFYIGLEPYEGRYTLQLQDWNERVFKEKNIEYEVITGDASTNANQIVTGEVLDAHARSIWSLSQIQKLVVMLRDGHITDEDIIFFEDMFTPGMEALPYIFDQTPAEFRPKVLVRCLAQTIDPDDFVHRTGMFKWMRQFELMADNFVDGIICASEEMVAHLRIAGFKSAAYVTGLPFGKQEVFERVNNLAKNYVGAEKAIQCGSRSRVIFAARWASEKQPHFYMDVAEQVIQKLTDQGIDIEFCIAQGGPLVSDDKELLERARLMADTYPENFIIYENLNKNEYYSLLAESCVIFNCALQDWVSNTLSEGDTLGAIPIYPAYRSFPEACLNMQEYMYIPWSIESAVEKVLGALLNKKVYQTLQGKISDNQDKSIERTLGVFEDIFWPERCPSYRGTLESPYKNGKGYRTLVSKTK